MMQSRMDHVCAAFKNTFYVTGGQTTKNTAERMEVVNGKIGKWEFVSRGMSVEANHMRGDPITSGSFYHLVSTNNILYQFLSHRKGNLAGKLKVYKGWFGTGHDPVYENRTFAIGIPDKDATLMTTLPGNYLTSCEGIQCVPK